jgi:predicted thioesterase
MAEAKGPLAAGLVHSRAVTVTDEMTPAHLRRDPIRVLSTPDMIRLVEQTAIEAVAPYLAPGQATVGTRVDIAHLAATPVGMTLTITVELTEVDRRRLAFQIAVRDEQLSYAVSNSFGFGGINSSIVIGRAA